MKNKFKLSLSIDYDEKECGINGVTSTVEETSEREDWCELTELFIRALQGAGFKISEDTEYCLRAISGSNSERIANAISELGIDTEDC